MDVLTQFSWPVDDQLLPTRIVLWGLGQANGSRRDGKQKGKWAIRVRLGTREVSLGLPVDYAPRTVITITPMPGVHKSVNGRARRSRS